MILPAAPRTSAAARRVDDEALSVHHGGVTNQPGATAPASGLMAEGHPARRPVE